jgi:hypothetical protein
VIKIFLEASEEELLLTKTAELGKILSNLDNTQKHNILVVHKGEQFS